MMTHFHCRLSLNKGCDFCIYTVHTFQSSMRYCYCHSLKNIGTAIQCNRTYSFLNKTGGAPTLGLLGMQLQRQSGFHNLMDYFLLIFHVVAN